VGVLPAFIREFAIDFRRSLAGENLGARLGVAIRFGNDTLSQTQYGGSGDEAAAESQPFESFFRVLFAFQGLDKEGPRVWTTRLLMTIVLDKVLDEVGQI
jgi:hypothetical protein